MRLEPEPAPALPPFTSLVVHGPYCPSAPIHLCLSLPAPHYAVLCTPSRLALAQALRDYGDPWLNAHSGTGAVASSSSRVSVFYPPSPAHLVAVLATLRTHDVSRPSAPVVPNLTLDRAPLLLVLHEPSVYFLPQPEKHTVSSYLLLIAHALSTIEYLSSQSSTSSPASLAVFDSHLDRLKLPVLRTPPRSTHDEPDGSEGDPRPEFVFSFARKYFELSITSQSQDQHVSGVLGTVD